MFSQMKGIYTAFAIYMYMMYISKCFGISYQKCTLRSSLNSRIYSDRRLLGYGIEWIRPIGFCDCLERCYNYGNCFSINYNRIQLNCTINAQKAEGSVTSESADGWEYVELPENFSGGVLTSSGCSSCPADHFCVVLKNTRSVCVDTLRHMHSDVLFLLDISGSISDDEWAKQQNFSKSVAREMDVSLHGDNVALFTVSTQAKEIFSLMSYYDGNSVLSAIDAADNTGGNSDYKQGLQDAYNYLIASKRSGYKTFIIGVTDHPASQTSAPATVSEIGNAGINVVTLGLMLTSAQLATDPDYFFPTTPDEITGLSGNVSSIILKKYF